MANNRVKSTNDLELKDRLVAINRVTKVTKGGRTFSFAAIVVVGNEDGIVGWGLGKAGEVTTAIAKGVEAAKKNLIKVPVHKGTIPHEQLAKFGGAQVLIRPASHGTGVGKFPCINSFHGFCMMNTVYFLLKSFLFFFGQLNFLSLNMSDHQGQSAYQN